MKQELLQSLRTLLLALILSVGVSYVYAWTGPTAAAPNSNVSAPINTGATAQSKSGALTVGSLGVGTVSPTSILTIKQLQDSDVNGGITMINSAGASSGEIIQGGDNNTYLINQNGAGSIYLATGKSSLGTFGIRLAIDSSGKMTVNGSNSTYGAVTMQGSKNTWSGINFRDVNGTNAGTLMMHPSYSGFFNQADNNWRFYVTDDGTMYGPGGVHPAQNSCYWTYIPTNASGVCAVGYYMAGLAPTNQNDVWVSAASIYCCQL